MRDIEYPLPQDEAVSTRMRGNRRRDTRPERSVRSLLHARGLRFRVDYPVVAGDVRVRPDAAFPRLRIAIFVDGCFWHSCPIHGNQPDHNRAYWASKLLRNAERDRRVTTALYRDGWLVIRAWEHESPDAVVDRIVQTVHRQRAVHEGSVRQREISPPLTRTTDGRPARQGQPPECPLARSADQADAGRGEGDPG